VRTYAFHHFGLGEVASCVTFEALGTDSEAVDEGRRLLVYHQLRCVEVCDGVREVAMIDERSCSMAVA
jgi:hypothetical protein